MSMTDPIADLLTRIRNALRARHASADVPTSGMRREVLRILKEEGYIEDFEVGVEGREGTVRVRLKYVEGGAPAITGLERVSRPGRRIYRGKAGIPRVRNGLGITIVSTPAGVMTGAACRQAGVGGEVLCNVW
jgi:small subunit ribosomal protein S8